MNTDSFTKLTVGELLDRLASDAPTPGGGSVAALTGALAAALGQMACALTIGKRKFAAVEDEVRELARRLERSGDMLRRLMDEDAAAYAELSAAFKLDKSDPQRREQVRQAATIAAEVPLETATLSRVVLRDLEALRGKANPNLASDVQAATHLARAALHAAAANVRVNLFLMEDHAADVIAQQLDALLSE